MTNPLLTVAIPTWNRARKLSRLLQALQDDLARAELGGDVRILVASNASTDDTSDVLENAQKSFNGLLDWSRHLRNIGYDANLLFLYGQIRSKFVWFIGDDDIPCAGALAKICGLARRFNPDVMLLPFIQDSAGHYVRPFEDDVRMIVAPREAVFAIDAHRKVSSYVLRKVELMKEQQDYLSEASVVGDGWMHLLLAFSVLERSPCMQVIRLSEAMARADGEVWNIRFSPEAILCAHKPLNHRWVASIDPGIETEKRGSAYCDAIEFLWSAQTGYLQPADPVAFDTLSRTLAWRWKLLAGRPKLIVKVGLLKMHLGYRCGRIMSLVRTAKTRMRAKSVR